MTADHPSGELLYMASYQIMCEFVKKTDLQSLLQ